MMLVSGGCNCCLFIKAVVEELRFYRRRGSGAGLS